MPTTVTAAARVALAEHGSLDAWARADYASYALDRDLQYVKKFLQSNCRYKTSYYERVKWDAYGAYHRIVGTTGQNLVNLATLCYQHGVAFKPGRVTAHVLAEANASYLAGGRS